MLRRFHGWPILFIQKQITVDQLVDQGAHTVLPGFRASQNLLDDHAIAESFRYAGGISQQLPGEIACDLGFVL